MDSQANVLPTQDNPKYKLWEGLKSKKLYTKDFGEFEKQFSTESAIGGLHDALRQRKLYTKGKEDFAVQFFPEKVEKTKEGKVAMKKEDTSIPLSEQPKLGYPELFNNVISPIVDQVYNKNTANIINEEKLTKLLPKVKEQKVKDLTVSKLMAENNVLGSLEGSNSYKKNYDNIMQTIRDDEWMPSWTPTSAKVQFAPAVEKQKNETIDTFAESIGETPDEVKAKIKNGDYEYDYKNNKVLTKGGFGDMAAYGLNNFFDKWKLYVDAAAAQERGQQKGNDNELKYVINQYQNLKKNQRQYVPHGESDIAKWAVGQGQMLGELGPYALIGPTGAAGAVMGIQTGGGAIEDIINQPGTLDEKAARIKGQMVDQTMLGFAQDAAFKLIHVNDRNSAKELMAQYGPTKKLFNTFKEVMRVAPSDAVKAGMVGVGTQVIDNLYKKNDGMNVEWDIPQAFVGGAALDLMMKSGSVLTHGFSVLKNALKFNLDKTNPEWFNRYSHDTQEVLNHIVSSPNNVYEKIVDMLDAHPSEDAKAAKEKIEAFRNHYNSLPKELPKATKFDALHLLQMKTEALAEAESAADATLKNALLKKATKIDEVLQRVIEGEKVDKKEPLLLPRFSVAFSKEDEEAKRSGFKDAEDFTQALNRRQGTSYEKFTDIPEEERAKFLSELIPAEQASIDTTIPDWFSKGREEEFDGKKAVVGAGAPWEVIAKNFKELGSFVKKTVHRKYPDYGKFKTIMKHLSFADDAYFGRNEAQSLVQSIHGVIIENPAQFELQLKAAEQAERLLSYYESVDASTARETMTKEQVKQTLREEVSKLWEKEQFNEEQLKLMDDMVDRLQTDNLFKLVRQWEGDSYSSLTNLLRLSSPDAFIHEIGHWGYFSVLTPEERLKFLRYTANRFGTSAKGRASEMAWAKGMESADGTSRLESNVMWNFQEYFADQFRQYYQTEVMTDPEMRTIYDKLKAYIESIIRLFKEKGYNPELTQYFDKIIDAKKKGTAETLGEQAAREKISEQQKIDNLSKATPEEIKAEFQKVKQEYDTRTATGGVAEIATRPTGEVPLESESAIKPFRAIEPTEGQLSAVDDWTRRNYGSEGELDIDYGRNGLSKYGQTREEFIRSRFCK